MVEQPFTLYIGEGISVQGRIDAIYEREDGTWEIVDFKTGKSDPDPLQLAIYARAVEEIWGRNAESSWLLLRTGAVRDACAWLFKRFPALQIRHHVPRRDHAHCRVHMRPSTSSWLGQPIAMRHVHVRSDMVAGREIKVRLPGAGLPARLPLGASRGGGAPRRHRRQRGQVLPPAGRREAPRRPAVGARRRPAAPDDAVPHPPVHPRPPADVAHQLLARVRDPAQSAAYLDDPSEEQSQDNIDFFHIFQAAECIREWFESSPDPALVAIDFYRALADPCVRDLVRGAARRRLPHPVHPPQRRAHPADRRRAGQGGPALRAWSGRQRSPPSGTPSSATFAPRGLVVRDREAGRRGDAHQPAARHADRRTDTGSVSAALPHLRDAPRADRRGVARGTSGRPWSTCTRWCSAGTTTATCSTRSATSSRPGRAWPSLVELRHAH